MQLLLMTTFLLQTARFPCRIGCREGCWAREVSLPAVGGKEDLQWWWNPESFAQTQDPFSPSSFSCLFTSHTLHPLFLLPLFSSSSHHIDQDCAKQRMWPSWDTNSARAYSRCEPDLYSTSVHILSCPAPALLLLIPGESFGLAHSSNLFRLAVFQAVETHFAIFPLGFCHLFPVILDFYSDEEIEFLSVPLRARCSDTRRWLAVHIG